MLPPSAVPIAAPEAGPESRNWKAFISCFSFL